MKQHKDIPPIMAAFMDKWFERESPWIYSRFALISAVAAMMGRDVYTYYGKSLYPNLYVVLTGEPGSKKSTVILEVRQLMSLAGYKFFGPDHLNRTSFMKSLSTLSHGLNAARNRIAVSNALGSVASNHRKSRRQTAEWIAHVVKAQADAEVAAYEMPIEEVDEETSGILDELDIDIQGRTSPMYLCMGELVDMCNRSPELLVTINNFWDNPDSYADATGIIIDKPILNMLGGLNPASFAKVFPVTEMQSGLITRVLLVRGRRSSRNIQPFDFKPSAANDETVIEELMAIGRLKGEMRIAEEAKDLLRMCATMQPKILDARFTYYFDRRHEQLMKLCMVIAAMWQTMTIEYKHVMLANTILTYNEWHMADALGEYGVNNTMKNADKLLNVLNSTPEKMADRATVTKALSGIINSTLALAEALKYLEDTGAITQVGGVYHVNERTIADRSVMDGTLYDSTMLPEWLETNGTL